MTQPTRAPMPGLPQAIPGFSGEQYGRTAAASGDYALWRHQYATTSMPAWQVSPAAILRPQSDADLIAAIRYARDKGLSLAVRSGGHGFAGTSSTFGQNLQVDMSHFADFSWDEPNNQITVSAGMRNAEVNEHLRTVVRPGDPDNHAFFPHGHCAGVGVGGHLQTGGYTLFERAVGMFIDVVAKFRIVLADCEACTIRWVHRPDPAAPDPANDELWFCVLGGSPGNFGIITHVTINLLWDKDFPASRGYRSVYLYRDLKNLSLSTDKGRQLHEHFLNKFARFNDSDDLPRDFCLSVVVAGATNGGWSGRLGTADHWSDLRHDWKTRHLMDQMPHPEVIVVDAMWCNTSGDPSDYDQSVRDFFADIEQIPKECESLQLGMMFNPAVATPMSVMWENYTYMGDREFKMPFHRRNLGGLASDLTQRPFASHVAGAVHELLTPLNRGVTLVSCFQLHGGQHSQAVVNATNNPTALGNRKLVRTHSVMDCFYATQTALGQPWPAPKALVLEWTDRLQTAMVGHPDAVFSPLDRRYMYDPFDRDGPRGQVNLDALHEHFYDSPAVYERVLQCKRQVDPHDVFTANLFCVGASRKYSAEVLARLQAQHAAPLHADSPLVRVTQSLNAMGYAVLATLSIVLAAATALWRQVGAGKR